MENGNEHPLRRNISHPAAPTPDSSNVDGDTSQDVRDEKNTRSSPDSHLREETASQTQSEHRGLKPDNVIP